MFEMVPNTPLQKPINAYKSIQQKTTLKPSDEQYFRAAATSRWHSAGTDVTTDVVVSSLSFTSKFEFKQIVHDKFAMKQISKVFMVPQLI